MRRKRHLYFIPVPPNVWYKCYRRYKKLQHLLVLALQIISGYTLMHKGWVHKQKVISGGRQTVDEKRWTTNGGRQTESDKRGVINGE